MVMSPSLLSILVIIKAAEDSTGKELSKYLVLACGFPRAVFDSGVYAFDCFACVQDACVCRQWCLCMRLNKYKSSYVHRQSKIDTLFGMCRQIQSFEQYSTLRVGSVNLLYKHGFPGHPPYIARRAYEMAFRCLLFISHIL